MNPKKYKIFKKGIADEVGVHPSVVDDFITFYYGKVRSKLSNLEYPRIHVDGLGTFVLRKSKLEKAIKKNKSLLGNIAKRTYNGFAKSEDINRNIDQMELARKEIEKNIKAKKDFKNKKSEQ
tara:strand:- start:8694 stop:9059 length:366 start_codon:yes stop_codon:yes gene_type:complete